MIDELRIERAMRGLMEWQNHVQTDSDIDRDITTALEALRILQRALMSGTMTQLSEESTTCNLATTLQQTCNQLATM